jgi:hypothetical protein
VTSERARSGGFPQPHSRPLPLRKLNAGGFESGPHCCEGSGSRHRLRGFKILDSDDGYRGLAGEIALAPVEEVSSSKALRRGHALAFLNRTPGWSPLVNSTPADSRAARIGLKVPLCYLKYEQREQAHSYSDKKPRHAPVGRGDLMPHRFLDFGGKTRARLTGSSARRSRKLVVRRRYSRGFGRR